MGQKVTLGGIHLDNVSPITWGYVAGVRPHQAVVSTDAKEAEIFLNPKRLGGTSYTLEINDAGTISKWKDVYVLGEAPTTYPYHRGVLLADRRWKWTRAHILGRYNIRRITGQRRLTSDDGTPVEIATIAPDFSWTPWSLKNGQRWNARQVLEDVLRKILPTDEFEYVLPAFLPELVPINDLDIDDDGPTALARALSFVPGVDLYVDREGKVILFDTRGGQEMGMLNRTGPEVDGGGTIHKEKSSFAAIRPRKIKVFYTREHVLRFNNYVEGGTRAENDETRSMDNVITVTDPQLTLADEAQSQVAAGSVITVDQFIAAVNADTSNPIVAGIPDLSHDVIQEAFFEDGLFNMYVPWGSDVPQPIWAGRINKIKSDYRQFFRINRRWSDRIYRFLAVRSDILDVTTGQRSPAVAYSDYAIEVSSRTVATDPNRQYLYENIEGYSANLADGKVSPAAVNVVDDQIGLIRLDYRIDPYGSVKKIFPSQLENVPTANSADRINNIDERSGDLFPKLKSNHRVAVLITAVPASPNSKRQLYVHEVSPDDVMDILPRGTVIGECNGPTMEVRVGAGVLTARFAWDDDSADVIEAAFGIDNPPGVEGEELTGPESVELKNLLVNTEDVEEYSKALSASIWSSMLDRFVGERTVRLDPELRPAGMIKRILQTVNPEGDVVSRIIMREEFQRLNPYGLLPDSVRRVIQREVIR